MEVVNDFQIDQRKIWGRRVSTTQRNLSCRHQTLSETLLDSWLVETRGFVAAAIDFLVLFMPQRIYLLVTKMLCHIQRRVMHGYEGDLTSPMVIWFWTCNIPVSPHPSSSSLSISLADGPVEAAVIYRNFWLHRFPWASMLGLTQTVTMETETRGPFSGVHIHPLCELQQIWRHLMTWPTCLRCSC